MFQRLHIRLRFCRCLCKVNANDFFTIQDEIDTEVTYTVEKDGNSVTLEENNSFTAEIGNYVIMVTATDAAGNTNTESVEFTVKDNVAPTVTTSGDTTGAVGTEINLASLVEVTDNVSQNVTVTYAVTFGISEISLTDGSKFTPSKGGTYLVKVTAVDEAENAAEETFTITVPDTVKPAISGIDQVVKTAQTGDTVNLAGITAQDDVSASCTLTITVELDGEAIVLSQEKTFVAEKAGTYKVSVTAQDGNSNTETATFDIVVTQAPSTGCVGSVVGISQFAVVICALACVAILFIRKKNTAK